jgi:hypothetical protein
MTDIASEPCPDPVHRLHDLVGSQAVQSWLDDGAPDHLQALVMALLDDLPERLYLDAVNIMIDAGWCSTPEAARENPHAALLALAVTVTGTDVE